MDVVVVDAFNTISCTFIHGIWCFWAQQDIPFSLFSAMHFQDFHLQGGNLVVSNRVEFLVEALKCWCEGGLFVSIQDETCERGRSLL